MTGTRDFVGGVWGSGVRCVCGSCCSRLVDPCRNMVALVGTFLLAGLPDSQRSCWPHDHAFLLPGLPEKLPHTGPRCLLAHAQCLQAGPRKQVRKMADQSSAMALAAPTAPTAHALHSHGASCPATSRCQLHRDHVASELRHGHLPFRGIADFHVAGP